VLRAQPDVRLLVERSGAPDLRQRLLLHLRVVTIGDGADELDRVAPLQGVEPCDGFSRWP
jgi:hypothetical protein